MQAMKLNRFQGRLAQGALDKAMGKVTIAEEAGKRGITPQEVASERRIQTLLDKSPGARLQAAQEKFDHGLQGLVGGGKVTPAGIEGLAKEFRSSIIDLGGDEAEQAKHDFEELLKDLKELAKTHGIKISTITQEEDWAKQQRQLEGLKDVANDFGNAFENAMLKVSRGGSSASQVLRGFATDFLGAINARMIGNFADQMAASFYNMGKGVTGKQKGGVIKAQNGMYISGNRTGDRNFALLEDGEYVLNKRLVNQVGRENLDRANFSEFPRFQGGGLSSKGRDRFGGTPGRGKSYPHKFFNVDPLTLQSGQNVLDDSELVNPFRFTDDVIIINPDGKIAPPPKLDFSKKLRYTGRSALGLHMTEKGVSGKAKHYTFKKDGEGGYLSSHGISIGDVRWPGTNAIEIDAMRNGKNILVGKQKGGFFSDVSAKDKKAAQKEMHVALNSSAYGDNLSGFAYANDPQMQRMAAFFENRKRERWAKQAEKQAETDALNQQMATAAVNFAISYGMSNLGSKGPKPKAGAPTNVPTDQGGGSGMLALQEGQAGPLAEPRGPGFFERNFSRQAFGKAWSDTKAVPRTMWEASTSQANKRFGGGKASAAGEGPTLAEILESNTQRIKELETMLNVKGDDWYLDTASGNRGRERASGGYIDNIPAMLTGGEYVMNRNAVQKYGTGFFSKINRMQEGGMVGDKAFDQGDVTKGGGGATTNHNNVGITVNFGADANPEVKTVQSGAQDDPRKFANKVRAAVLNVINEEQRVGGRLRNQRKGRR